MTGVSCRIRGGRARVSQNGVGGIAGDAVGHEAFGQEGVGRSGSVVAAIPAFRDVLRCGAGGDGDGAALQRRRRAIFGAGFVALNDELSHHDGVDRFAVSAAGRHASRGVLSKSWDCQESANEKIFGKTAKSV